MVVSAEMGREGLESSSQKGERKKPGDTKVKPSVLVETGTKCLFYFMFMFICMICKLSLNLRPQQQFQKWYVLFVLNAIRHLVTGSLHSHSLGISFYLFTHCVSQEVHSVWSSSDLSSTSCK